MSFKKMRAIPEPAEMIDLIPVPADVRRMKQARDLQLKAITEGTDDRFLVMIGPCSADDEDSVIDYVTRLAAVNEKVKDKLFIVPRVYTNKPRTTGEGYKGMLHQPNPHEAPNMADGILSIRRLHVRVMRETGLTAADEMLYPENWVYCEDLLSYIAVGARSVENQLHRLTSSGIDMPVGMKNPTSGDLNVMYNAIQAAQGSHSFIYQGHEVRSDGNKLTHAIMRGSVNKHGDDIANYHYEDLLLATEMYDKRGLANPMIIVDVNHNNSGKRFYEQPRIAKEILYSRRYNAAIKGKVRGLMIESYIVEGKQPVGGGVYGQSITDACLGWEASEALLYHIADIV